MQAERSGKGPPGGLHREESESKLSRMEATKGLQWGERHDPMDIIEGSFWLLWGEWAILRPEAPAVAQMRAGGAETRNSSGAGRGNQKWVERGRSQRCPDRVWPGNSGAWE